MDLLNETAVEPSLPKPNNRNPGWSLFNIKDDPFELEDLNSYKKRGGFIFSQRIKFAVHFFEQSFHVSISLARKILSDE
jgi:hypothetical protein